MKAIGFKTSLSIDEKDSFIEFETAKPIPGAHDLLVKIDAISVNPVDFKIRQSAAKDTVLETPKIIGWDAVGIVQAVGEKTTLFEVGDPVYYAGDITKQGSNAEYQIIDERIVGRKPKSLTIEEGVSIVMDTTSKPEFIVQGNLYALGTSANPIKFSVPDFLTNNLPSCFKLLSI